MKRCASNDNKTDVPWKVPRNGTPNETNGLAEGALLRLAFKGECLSAQKP